MQKWSPFLLTCTFVCSLGLGAKLMASWVGPANRSEIEAHLFGKAYQLAQLSPATDQADTYQCWAVAAASRFDFWASKHWGRAFKFSPKFIVYQQLFLEVSQKIRQLDFTKQWGSIGEETSAKQNVFGYYYYFQGGTFPEAVAIVQKTGIVPEASYSSPQVFPTEDVPLYLELNSFIGQYHHLYKQNRARFWTSQELATLHKELKYILDKYLGPPPESFIFEGQRFTPLTFAHMYIPHWMRKAQGLEINYFPDPAHADRLQQRETSLGTKYLAYTTNSKNSQQIPWRVLQVIEESIKKDEAILIQYKIIDRPWDNFYLQNETTGDIGFAVNGHRPSFQLDWNDPNWVDHYVLAVGGVWGADGHLEEILVKNPWALDNGRVYHRLKKDYFWLIVAAEVEESLIPQFKKQKILPQK